MRAEGYRFGLEGEYLLVEAASFRPPIRRVKAGERYYVYLRGINDIHGNRIGRRAIVIGTIGPVESG